MREVYCWFNGAGAQPKKGHKMEQLAKLLIWFDMGDKKIDGRIFIAGFLLDHFNQGISIKDF